MAQELLTLSVIFSLGAGASLLVTFVLLFLPPTRTPKSSSPATVSMGLDDTAKLVEAAAKLTTALSHAGPPALSAFLTIFLGAASMYFASLASVL